MRVIAILAVLIGSVATEQSHAEAPPSATTRPAATAPVDSPRHGTVLGPEYPEYTPAAGQPRGTLVSVGSPFVSSLVNRWADALGKANPDLIVNVGGVDSALGPPALSAGTAQLVPMIRRISGKERAAFTAKLGYPPTELIVAIDAQVVYVEKTNPVARRGLTLTELDSAFSSERRRGGAPARVWGDFGLTGDWAARPIAVYGLPPDRAPHLLFSERIMQGASLTASTHPQPTYSSLIQAIAADPGGIGYCSIFYRTRRTRPVPIQADDGKLILPTLENCRNGTYPLARPLYLYVNKPPGRPLDPLTGEFVSLILSRQGQQIVVDGGNYPLVAEEVVQQRHFLEK